MSSNVLFIPKTVIGSGDSTLLIEPRGNAVRIKPRGGPEFWVQNDVLPELARTLGALARNLERAVA